MHTRYLGTAVLTVSVCLCGVTPNVALFHSILEHQTRGSVVGVGGQVVSEPMSSFSIAGVLFEC